MSTDLQITDATVIRLNEEVSRVEKGSREFVLLDKTWKVPDECKSGFKTWHANKPECATCPLVVVCFAARTGTPLTTTYASKQRKQQRQGNRTNMTAQTETATEQKPAAPTPGTPKSLNPFKAGSKPHQARELLLKIIEDGDEKLTTDQIEQKFSDLGLVRAKTRADRPNLLNRQMLNYVVSTGRGGKQKTPGANHAPFYGLVTVDGSKPNFTFSFNIDALRGKVEELKASQVQPDASDDDEDDDE